MEKTDLAGDETSSDQTNTNIILQIIEHPEGSITRPFIPLSPPSADNPDAPVYSKDVPLNPTNNTSLRIFRPSTPNKDKLPIILYFHGGGFVIFSAASTVYHTTCEEMARAVPALVVSLDYRLAPEHRLPAAYDDAVEAVLWVRAQARDPEAADPWLTSHGDFSRCFIMGSSSGGNMAYQAALRLTALQLAPIGLAGIIFSQPYFGGVQRTSSEEASANDIVLPLKGNDLFWRLALPEGATRSHEFCDLTAVLPPPCLSLLPKCLVIGCDGDPLIDRQRVFAKMLVGAGVSVVSRLDDKGHHAMELFDPAKAQLLFHNVREFMYNAAAA